MKVLVIAVLAFASAQAAMDLSKLAPDDIRVWPKMLPEVFDPRIVNGDEAEQHQFPHQVALEINGRSFCGGSIIAENVVLTAAHCVDAATSVQVTAGAHNIQIDEESQQIVVSTQFIVHQDWDRSTLVNDIALVILNGETLNLDGETTKAIELYNGQDTLEDVDATVSGWGRPSDSVGTISPVLRYATDVIITNVKCNNFYGNIKATHICLNGSNRKSSCNGDSGGPLTTVVDGQLQEIGIVSFGSAFGCGIGFPSAYTRVGSYADWVEEQVAGL